jgi:hypothetical protein
MIFRSKIIAKLLFPGLIIGIPILSDACEPPEILNIDCISGNVLITFQTNSPDGLIGFNFYRNGEFIDFMPESGDTLYDHMLTYQPPGNHSFCITSLCVQQLQGMPSDTIESDPDCENAGCFYGIDLPFQEDWSLGSFELTEWNTSSDDWMISEEAGNTPPAAIFNPADNQGEYQEYLESYYLNAYGMTEGHIYLEYDLSLSSTDTTGPANLYVLIWDHESNAWDTVATYNNSDGSFEWTRDTIDIRQNAMGNVFRIRFMVDGDDPADIEYWGIDNINVYRKCDNLFELETSLVNDTCISINLIGQITRQVEDYDIYVILNGNLLYIYSQMWDPIPNPYCVPYPGEYCFWGVTVWVSETDECESDYSVSCEQVMINSSQEIPSPHFVIYPNPVRAGNSLVLSVLANEIEIFDLTGNLISTVIPADNSGDYTIEGLKPGLYLLKLSEQDRYYCQKLVIQ